MSKISLSLLEGKEGKFPLSDYPWMSCAESLMLWAKNKSSAHRAFVFDLLMSLAYIDTISSIQGNIKKYDKLIGSYNSHLGFTNLCFPRFLEFNEWSYHKAAKPQSGAIGKLTSEIVLKCIEVYFDDFLVVKSIGGTGLADAVLIHKDGRVILSEIKAAPLTTFSFLFDLGVDVLPEKMSRSQTDSLKSALYLHSKNLINLGFVGGNLWPFQAVADFFNDPANNLVTENYVNLWNEVREAYTSKNKDSSLYFLANASGQPPKIAKDVFGWPAKESISDSKTSAGLDRTDDIKKGVYQSFKLGVEVTRDFPDKVVKTAIISNLPAYRHGKEYIEPFYDVLWGFDHSFVDEGGDYLSVRKKDVKRPFDYIIALDHSYMRDQVV